MHIRTVIALCGLAACLPEAPAQPTFTEDVWPILRTSCIRCHSGEPIGGAPPTFRLDSYFEALRMAPLIAERAGRRGDMPPGGPELNRYQRDVLINWASESAFATFGTANAPPTITATVTNTTDGVLVDYLITDPEQDAVQATLTLDGRQVAVLQGGAGQVRIDTRQFVPGDWPLEASLIDLTGNDAFAPIDVALGQVTVAHANTAPRAAILWPFPYWVVADQDPAGPADACGALARCVQVQLGECANVGTGCVAPDGAESYTADVVAVRGGQTVTLASAAPLTPGVNAIAYDPADLTEGRWTLRVIARDGTGESATEVGPIVIGHRTTTLTFAQDILPFVASHCQPCHDNGGPLGLSPVTRWFVDGDAEATRLYLVGPDPFSADGSGRAGVYQRVVVLHSMTPGAADSFAGVPAPTVSEFADFEEWMLAGGPQ